VVIFQIKSLLFPLTWQHTLVTNFFILLVLNSDTTDHIGSSLTHFTSYHQINPMCVKLPNGNQVILNYVINNVFIKKNHIINNVLYICSFTFSFLLLTTFIDNLSCVITFFILIVVAFRTRSPWKWLVQLKCKIKFIYSESPPIKNFKSNLSNFYISPILSILLLVFSKLFDIFD